MKPQDKANKLAIKYFEKEFHELPKDIQADLFCEALEGDRSPLFQQVASVAGVMARHRQTWVK